MRILVLFLIMLITVSMASCLTSQKPSEKTDNISKPKDTPNTGNVSEQQITEANLDFDGTLAPMPDCISISANKEIVDLNNNGQLDEGEKVKITYAVNDSEHEIRRIRVIMDGYDIGSQNNKGTYTITTDPLSIGQHGILIIASDSERKRQLQPVTFNVAGIGPSFYFPDKWRNVYKKGEQFEVVISAVNPMGNPKAKALLILKPPGDGISIMESWCKGLQGMCTGEYELEPGDAVRSISLHMQADKSGTYLLNAEIRYQFENDNRTTIPRFHTITIVVTPLPGEVQQRRR